MRAASVALAVTAFLLAGLVWTAVVSLEQVEADRRYLRLDGLRGTIGRLDEVLTMSARMGAVTGDPQWEARYREAEPQLSRAIQEALALTSGTGGREAVARTDAANTALVEMEKRAFDLIRENKMEAARATLFSPAYDAQKGVYAAGMEQLDSALAESVRRTLDGTIRRVRSVMVLSAAATLSLVSCWFVALRNMNRGKLALLGSHERLSRQSAELAELNTELDRKVGERTRALEVEIVERTRVQDQQARVAADLELQAAVMRNMREGMLLVRMDDGTIVYTNAKLEEMLGYGPRELSGQPASMVNYDDGSGLAERRMREMLAQIEGADSVEYEVENVRKDGRRLLCSGRASIVTHPRFGRVCVAVHEDISERQAAAEALRESEGRFRQLADTMPQIVWTARPDGWNDYFNQRWFD